MGYFKRLMGSNQSREYATPLGSIMKDESNPGFSTLSDLEEVAAKKANKSAWAYIQGGAGEEWTLRVNREAFHRRTLRPRVLVNVETLEIGTTLLGTRTSAPFYVSPTASHSHHSRKRQRSSSPSQKPQRHR